VGDSIEGRSFVTQRKKTFWLGVVSAAILTCTTQLAAAQDSTTQELHDLRELVRQQAAMMHAMQRQLDDIEARQRLPRGRAAATAGPLPGAKSTASVTTQTAAAPRPAQEAKPNELPARSALTATQPGHVPTKDEQNVVVTQQPGNLPGRSTVQPYTGANMASPGSVAPVAAAPVSSGADRVHLSLSGQVDRMLLYGNDGKASAVRNVDNNNSSTRLRVVGEAQISDTASGGINLETELRPNSSANTTLTQNLPQPASAATFTVRQAEAYMQDIRWGGVRLGFGSTASYLTTEVDLSGTAVASYSQVADLDGGFAFRQRAAARVPSAGGQFVLSPAGSYGPAVGAVFNFFDGLGRDNRVRYDTPRWNGFGLATSFIDGDAFDIALRYSGEFGGNQLVGAVAFADALARHHLTLGNVAGLPGAVPNLYGYAGVPTGSNGTEGLSTPTTPALGDVSANGSYQYDASVSLLLTNGINFTFAGGYRDVNYLDPQGSKLTPTFLFGKIGYRTNFFTEVGLSAMSFDIAQNNSLQFSGDRARSYSLAFVQNVDAAATELFIDGRIETLHRTYADYYNLIAIGLGARVRF
jgi:predicted porin